MRTWKNYLCMLAALVVTLGLAQRKYLVGKF